MLFAAPRHRRINGLLFGRDVSKRWVDRISIEEMCLADTIAIKADNHKSWSRAFWFEVICPIDR